MLFLILNFRSVLKVVYFLLGDSPASEFYMHHWTISFPLCGIADSRIVFTAVPKRDICLHSRTYPIGAVVIVRNKITTATDHVCAMLYDPWYVFRPVCKQLGNLGVDGRIIL